jgi:hypothetical protein
MIIHKWISSDGSELVPTTDVKINLTLPYLFAYQRHTLQFGSSCRLTTVKLPEAGGAKKRVEVPLTGYVNMIIIIIN